MRWLLLLAVLCSGCLSALPPHVIVEVKNVEGVDVLWWTNEALCQVRVIHETAPRHYGSFTVDVDKELCREMMRGRGYKWP